MKISILQHAPFEGPGLIAEWASERNADMTITKVFANEPLPDLDSFDLLILMGGPMSVNDEKEYPWLIEEKKFIRKAIERNMRIMGICLGAQLIASSLGKNIYPNPEKEIGWFQVDFTDEIRKTFLFNHFPHSMVVFHWHGETFEIPESAMLIGSSPACRNQGFLMGRSVIALQFHLEETGDSLQEISTACAAELQEGKWIQSEESIRNGIGNVPAAKSILYQLLDKLISL